VMKEKTKSRSISTSFSFMEVTLNPMTLHFCAEGRVIGPSVRNAITLSQSKVNPQLQDSLSFD
jgi:hypothetical protein